MKRDILLNIIFPPFCLICRKFGSLICKDCVRALITVDSDICPYCEKMSLLGLTHPKCVRRNGVDGLISCYMYEEKLKKIFWEIKYSFIETALYELIKIIPSIALAKLFSYKKLFSPLIIVPVPLNKHKHSERGFNQSEIIGRYIAAHINDPLHTRICKRIKNTLPQARIKDKRIRYSNMRNAFAIVEKEKIKGSTVLIIDDVWTTGSTIKSLAQECKKAGARKVFAFTIAR